MLGALARGCLALQARPDSKQSCFETRWTKLSCLFGVEKTLTALSTLARRTVRRDLFLFSMEPSCLMQLARLARVQGRPAQIAEP